jgi:2-dehydro-3-deoxyphosphogluconate aldolase/(4S)-4-hydroxy-2-oxoglutarate aldolase
MVKAAVVKRILNERLFAVLRLKDTKSIEGICQSIIKGGITTLEVTLNSGDAYDAIYRLTRAFPDALIGAGTVIGYEATVKAIESGAQFVVSPVTDLDMLAVASQVSITTIAGALTPTEAWQATQAGADFVKVFPLAGIGPDYIKAMRGPLPDIKYVATNGVRLENLAEYYLAGAVAVGLGSPLVNDRDVELGDLQVIEQRARHAVAIARAK